MKPIIIHDFSTVFTNADQENLPNEALTVLKNMRPVNGKLVKTYGAGVKLDSATGNVINNFLTLMHDDLTDDEVYIAVYINAASGNQVVFLGWTGSAWVAIENLADFSAFGTYYHKEATNPIVFYNEMVRFLPGNVGLVGANEAKGIWLGYIDREYFDGLYDPSALFYDYPTVLTKPALTFTQDTKLHGGVFTAWGSTALPYETSRFYRFSYLYDGNQESLLSEPFNVIFKSDRSCRIMFTITKLSHNKRVTGMKIYRTYGENTFNSPEGPYALIHTIDFTRDAPESDSAASGAYWGGKRCYIPDATDINFIDGTTYEIQLGDETWQDISTPRIGTGHTQFGVASSWDENHWDDSWEIRRKSDSVSMGSGTNGSYGGQNTVIIAKDLGSYDYAGGVLKWRPDDGIDMNYIIADNYKYAINLSAQTYLPIASTNQPWAAISPLEGLYEVEDDTTEVNYYFYETGFPDGAAPPNINEVSMKVNGRFARMINGRLFQYDVVLDPGGENEVHIDGLTYSALGQPDSNPVSNLIPIIDNKGGPGTGLAEVFGNPVAMKKNSLISLVGTKTFPEDPTRWALRTSAHSVGNIAPYGYIEHLDTLYTVFYDGIYRFTPNNLAESDSTPVELLKITNPIEDVFLALSTAQKEAVISGYDPLKNEIWFKLNTAVWAFNIVTESWRQIVSAITPALFSHDEDANLLVYDATTEKVYSAAISEAVGVEMKTKVFDITNEENRAVVLRRLKVNYKSATALTLNIYTEYSGTAAYTLTLAARSTIGVRIMAPRIYAKKFTIEIKDAETSTTVSEIHKIEAYID